MTAGFVSLLDFVGYPAEAGTAQGGRGKGIPLVRRLLMMQAMQEARSRSLLEMAQDRGEALLVAQFAERMTFARRLHDMEAKHQKRVAEDAMYTVLLSEV